MKPNLEMENKLQEHFKFYCQHKCPYNAENNYIEVEIERTLCIKCDSEFGFTTEVEYDPCESCQIQNFIKEIRDEL